MTRKVKRMKTPLQRTVEELAGLVESIRSDCAGRTTDLLANNEPDDEIISDLAKLDEALSKASEAVANVCSVLVVRERLRRFRAAATRSRKAG